MKTEETIKGYKGFNPDMTCRGFQYEVGKEYETKKAKACQEGFHFCEYPLNVLSYYEPSTENGINRFCEVEGSGDFDKPESDKVACTKIKIKAEIGIIGLVNAAVEYIKSKVDWKENSNSNMGDYSAATNTGNRSAAEVTGKESVAIVTGKDSKARGTIGNWLVLTERGEWNGENYPIKKVRAFKVDGIEIKEDVFYKLVDGKAVECE